MQEHVNLTIPLACPHCLAELLTTLDEVEAKAIIECAVCRTAVELRPEDLPLPPRWNTEPPEQLYCGIQF
jgi:transcription elongation factor Elf1